MYTAVTDSPSYNAFLNIYCSLYYTVKKHYSKPDRIFMYVKGACQAVFNNKIIGEHILLLVVLYISAMLTLTQAHISEQKKDANQVLTQFASFSCGEGGIRTPGSSHFNGFQDRRNRPLCHLSLVLFPKAMQR